MNKKLVNTRVNEVICTHIIFIEDADGIQITHEETDISKVADNIHDLVTLVHS